MKFKGAKLTKSGKKYDVTLRLTKEEIGTLADGISSNFEWGKASVGSERFWESVHDVLINTDYGVGILEVVIDED